MKITVRPLEKDDEALILRWRNDVDVRRNSFNSEIISKRRHKKWFSKILKSKNIVLLIGQQKQNGIGHVRFDISPRYKTAVITVSTDRRYRRKGLSVKMIRASISYLLKRRRLLKIVAKVKQKNHVSSNMFLKCGFKKVRKGRYKGHKIIIYELPILARR